MSTKSGTFIFKPGTRIGAPDADLDPFLQDCFVSTAVWEAARQHDGEICVLVGRSGTGKSAILRRLEEQEPHTIRIQPEELAFQFLSSSELLQALRASEVRLDYFYKLLWRHTFIVAILKHYFPDGNAPSGRFQQFISWVQDTIAPNLERKRAVDYLREWGTTFFAGPREHIQRLHETLEKSMQAKFRTSNWMELLGVGGSLEGGARKRHEFEEVRREAQQVVSSVQLDDLNSVFRCLDETVIQDRQKRCYIVIDDLDRLFVDDALYYDLVRALLLEIYDFRKVKLAKILVAVRDNLLHRVESEAPSRNYQPEKLASQRIRLLWDEADLRNLLDKRVARIAGDQYTTYQPSAADVLPQAGSRMQQAGFEYMVRRSYRRPRDLIDFFNKCVERARNQPRVSPADMRSVEPAYSKGRWDSILAEWLENFAGLDVAATHLLKDRTSFSISEWNDDQFSDLFLDPNVPRYGWLSTVLESYAELDRSDRVMATDYLCKEIILAFYETGLVGVRLGSGGPLLYSHTNEPRLSHIDLRTSIRVIVHPALRAYLAPSVLE